MLLSTKPDSKGKEAVLARARQLTEFKWTPRLDVPTYTNKDGKTVHPAGVEVTGVPYSSTEPTDKFITENISFETLLSAIENPDSALYKKDLGGHNNSWTSFGIVCNGLARYALGIRRRYSTKRWLTIPGMRKIAEPLKYTADEIKLCDVLYAFGNGRNHVALITDLLRDETGKVVQVEVSEAVRPSCKRARYETEEFYEKYKLFGLCRYDFVDSVPENDPEIDALLFERRDSFKKPAISVDYGNKSNYLADEDVLISVFAEGENEVEIRRGDEVIEKLAFVGEGKITRKFERGYYKAILLNTGDSVEFCVNQPKISFKTENGAVTVKADSSDPDSRILYMEFREKRRCDIFKKNDNLTDGDNIKTVFYDGRCASLAKVEELSEEEITSGIITRAVPEDAGNFKIYFENKYGIWTHTMIRIV